MPSSQSRVRRVASKNMGVQNGELRRYELKKGGKQPPRLSERMKKKVLPVSLSLTHTRTHTWYFGN